MAWIRLSDDYNDHPKFDNLSDGAFRLWHQGMGFCRKYKTDGLIPILSLRKFKAYSQKRARELETPWQADVAPLWHLVEGFGIRVHDYLEWNPSKEEDQERRTESRDQMRVLRDERRTAKGVPPVSTNSVLTTPPVSKMLREGMEKDPDPDQKNKESVELFGASKRPIFSGQRFTVFEWNLNGLSRLLGPYFESFDVHTWFFELDERVAKSAQVVPQRDNGAWLLAQTQAEAQRRGLPVAVPMQAGKLTTRLAAALENIRREEVS